eukprot:1148399-Pelagomonas_calceolata.AAC.2
MGALTRLVGGQQTLTRSCGSVAGGQLTNAHACLVAWHSALGGRWATDGHSHTCVVVWWMVPDGQLLGIHKLVW